MFMTAPTIVAAATATIVPSGNYCVVSLESQAVTGIDATGSTNVNLGCGMITNSTSLTAAVATGASSVSASPIAAVGGIPLKHALGHRNRSSAVHDQGDRPFGTVPLPTPSSCGAFPTNKHEDVMSITNPTGTRCFNTTMDINGTVTLASGDLHPRRRCRREHDRQHASLTCSDCTFILMNSSSGSVGSVNINGGKLVISSPNTGCTIGNAGCYDGMTFYQSRSATSGNNILINGNANSSIEGALYFPTANLTFNGTAGMTTNCMQIVGKDVTFTGNSAVSNTCDPTKGGGHSFAGSKVRLVE